LEERKEQLAMPADLDSPLVEPFSTEIQLRVLGQFRNASTPLSVFVRSKPDDSDVSAEFRALCGREALALRPLVVAALDRSFWHFGGSFSLFIARQQCSTDFLAAASTFR